MENEEIEIEDNHDFEYMLSNTNKEIDIKVQKKEDSFIVCEQRKNSDLGVQTDNKKVQDLFEMSFINKHNDMS